MDTASQQIKWHYETLPKETKQALDFFSKEKWLEENGWYLAGGTALALQCGNRTSYDLDFFTTEKSFDSKKLLINLIDNKDWLTDIASDGTVYGELFKAKISFIAYPFFIPKENFIKHGILKVARPIDIAVMKIIAVSQRGKKRDFFDLYWCVKNVASFKDIILRLKEQYPSVAHDYHHILKSLVYFNDAESDPDTIIFFDIKWSAVKKFFQTEIPKISKEIIKLS